MNIGYQNVYQLSNALTKWSIYGIARVVGTSFCGEGKDISNSQLRFLIQFNITNCINKFSTQIYVVIR